MFLDTCIGSWQCQRDSHSFSIRTSSKVFERAFILAAWRQCMAFQAQAFANIYCIMYIGHTSYVFDYAHQW